MQNVVVDQVQQVLAVQSQNSKSSRPLSILLAVLLIGCLVATNGDSATAATGSVVLAELEGPVYAPTQSFPCGGTNVVVAMADGARFTTGDNVSVFLLNPSNEMLRFGFSSASRGDSQIKVYVRVCNFDLRYSGPDATYTARVTFVSGDGKIGKELLLRFALQARPALDQARSTVQAACRTSGLFSVAIEKASLVASKSGQVAVRGVLYRGGVVSPGDQIVMWSGTSLSGRKVTQAITDAKGGFELRIRPTKSDLYFTVDVPNRSLDIDGYLPYGGFPSGVLTLFPDSRSGGRNLKFDPVYGGGFPLPQVSTECVKAMNEFRLVSSNPKPEEPFRSPKAEPAGTFRLVTPDGAIAEPAGTFQLVTPDGTITVKRCRVKAYTKKDGTRVDAHFRRCP